MTVPQQSCKHEPVFKLTKWTVAKSYFSTCKFCGSAMEVHLPGIDEPPPPKLRLVK